jgi:hypothetical protein
MQKSSRIPLYKLTNQHSKCDPYPNGWKWCIHQITGFRRPWLKRLARYTARSMMQARAYFVGGRQLGCREVCCRDLAERSSCRDLAQRSLLESLSRDLVEIFLTEILPRDLSRRDLVQISCQETSHRSLVQRSCTDISARGLVKRCFVERFCRDIARPLTEILYRDLV